MEPTLEEQAAMAVALDDKVRELVRQHILEAFNDYEFMSILPVDYLHSKLTSRSYGDIGFAEAVRNVIRAQMNK